jgi:hypothetical protein
MMPLGPKPPLNLGAPNESEPEPDLGGLGGDDTELLTLLHALLAEGVPEDEIEQTLAQLQPRSSIPAEQGVDPALAGVGEPVETLGPGIGASSTYGQQQRNPPSFGGQPSQRTAGATGGTPMRTRLFDAMDSAQGLD